ncbi:MAG: PatB family C-S lyase [Bacteroidales bacterium]
MSVFDFDEVIDRRNTNSVKYDKLKLVFGTDEILPMWVADMDFKSPAFVMDAIRKRAGHEILGYSIRTDSFSNAVKNWMKRRHQWEVENNWITFSPGVVPAFTMAVLAYTKPGDKIIVQPPVYFPFFTSVTNTGRQLVYNQLKKDGLHYTFDFDDLKKKLDSRTKMIILCHPHNPVGRVWKKDELIELAEICLKNDILIVSDEIHSDLVFKGHKHIPLCSLSDQVAQITISTYAASKTFNLAGLSTSVVIIPNKKLRKSFDNLLNDFHLNGGNIFGTIALESAYNYGDDWLDELMDYLQGNLNTVKQFAAKHNDKMCLIEPEATYLLWFDFSKLNMADSELETFMLKKARLGLNSGTMFGPGGSGFYRMNIACPRAVVNKALNQLDEALNSL